MIAAKTADNPNLGREIGETAIGLTLLMAYLTIFTVGSQLSSAEFRSPQSLPAAAMLVLTYRESSVCLLGIVAASLGAWRRINQDAGGPNTDGRPWFIAYTSACIGGLVTTGVVVGLPNLIDSASSLINLTRDGGGGGQRNYIMLATIGSFVGFLSGYDRTFFDRIVTLAAGKLGLAAVAAPAPTRQAPVPAPEEAVPAGSGRLA